MMLSPHPCIHIQHSGMVILLATSFDNNQQLVLYCFLDNNFGIYLTIPGGSQRAFAVTSLMPDSKDKISKFRDSSSNSDIYMIEKIPWVLKRCCSAIGGKDACSFDMKLFHVHKKKNHDLSSGISNYSLQNGINWPTAGFVLISLQKISRFRLF